MHTSSPLKRAAIRPEIQALRALAVTLVLLNHSWPVLAPGGFLGVDIFFVISGYLITGMLLREHRDTGRIRIARFYGRRARRLLPAAFVVLLACVVLTFLVVPRRQWDEFFVEIGASALYAQNWAQGLGPWTTSPENYDITPVMHFWSLSVEEQFYLVWPLLMVAVIVLAVRFWRNRVGLALLVVMGALSIASFTHAAVLVVSDGDLAYFSTFTRAWEFGIGALLAVAASRRAAASSALVVTRRALLTRQLVFWGACAVIVASVYLVVDDVRVAGWPALAPTVATAAIIWAADSGVPLGARWLVHAGPVQWVGDQSYSLYLWHWPVLLFVPFITGIPSPSWLMAILMALIVLLAWATRRYVEDPLRYGRGVARAAAVPATSVERRRQRWVTVGMGVVAIAIVGSSVAGAWVNLDERAARSECTGGSVVLRD
ncbi:acyltransferase family protein [Compostimonas suwonensis]|uniref:acyltransferase family protein n=1 Tax=Compostimonas suwonensis TaxID=1048394 RepID=UPI002482205F|nr:acyltransferase [Compostimonas suwonensis]